MSTSSDRLAAVVRELVAEVRTLRHELAQHRPALDPMDVGLLMAITAAAPGATFTAGEVIADAQVNPALRRALDGADIDSPRELAGACRRLRDRPTSGFILRRGPRTRSGYAWRVEPV